jgi:type VI secretion system secreted protein VgrG
MEISTPLGDDLLFHSMHAREEVSRLSEFQIDLLSPRGDISLDDVLGKNVTVTLELPDEGRRFYNGYVTRFSQSGMYGRYHRYHAIVRPWLWFLTRTADCRIFQEMPVPDILKLVFADHGTADYKLELTSSYRTWTYCVQYRETDFNFVSRLMEEEGIYYYFRHTEGHNTLVLTDSLSQHTPAPGCEQLPFIPPDRLVRPEIQHVSSWEISRQVQPGVYAHDDYDLERPSVELRTKKALPRSYAPSDYEVYDYPGGYVQKADGEQYAAVRIEEFGAQFETAHATTNARGLAVGCALTLSGHPRGDQNREHLVLAANFDLEYGDYEGMPQRGGASYRCSFVAMSSKEQFRPRRSTPKPFVQGPQTAVVVGPKGDEIYTDQYGRVKVQFRWDRYGKMDENSSCWIRVSQDWAGKHWGAIFLPRIGQEVIVEFLEGDPDCPIITGRVYNAEQAPPYDLPAEMTKSTVKSNSSKGGGGSNELRFEDKKGSEQIYLHAQKDMDIVVENERRETVKGSRHLTVKKDRKDDVGGSSHLKVAGDGVVQIGGDASTKVGANLASDVGASHSHKVGQEIYYNAGMKIVLEAGMEITLKGSGGFVKIDPAGVTIQGTLVQINSGGAPGTGSAQSPKTPAKPDEAEG